MIIFYTDIRIDVKIITFNLKSCIIFDTFLGGK